MFAFMGRGGGGGFTDKSREKLGLVRTEGLVKGARIHDLGNLVNKRKMFFSNLEFINKMLGNGGILKATAMAIAPRTRCWDSGRCG